MTIPRNSELASRLLAKAAPAVVPSPSDEARARAIAAIETALEQRRWRRRVRVGMLALTAAAACGFFVLRGSSELPAQPRGQPVPSALVAHSEPAVVAHFMGDGARIVGGGELLGSGGQALAAGSRVIALPHGQALLNFAGGSKVTIEEGGEVRLIELAASNVLALERGALLANVAKLGPDRRFVVRTEDAEVEVHGTSFRVATTAPDLACGAGTITRVEVYEGVVSVRANGGQERVRDGEQWPAGCTHTSDGDAKRAEPPRAERKHAGLGLSKPASAARSSESNVSDLTRENDMFSVANAAQRAGDLQRAVRELESMLAAYPEGPLAQDATVKRMKLLEQLDPARARAAAREYVARYPRGFARADAEAILAARK